MALDYVTHDEGPQSLKSNFYHEIASKLKNLFIIVNCVVFNLRFALNILKTNYLQDVCKLTNMFSIYKLIIILFHQIYCMTSSA